MHQSFLRTNNYLRRIKWKFIMSLHSIIRSIKLQTLKLILARGTLNGHSAMFKIIREEQIIIFSRYSPKTNSEYLVSSYSQILISYSRHHSSLPYLGVIPLRSILLNRPKHMLMYLLRQKGVLYTQRACQVGHRGTNSNNSFTSNNKLCISSNNINNTINK
jgi:hypothetical protein